MKAFVTGANGQLGHDLLPELSRRGHDAIGSGSRARLDWDADGTFPYVSMDIADGAAVADTLTEVRPDVVIHCAAWTAVDAAEDDENRARVRAVNAQGTAYLADACAKLGCKLIYVSTDYVFDGSGETPWKADETRFAPLNYYGETKLEGEKAVKAALQRYFIVRTAWVFGNHGANFVRTMRKLGKTRLTLRVVNDQIGTPTYTPDLARLLADMAETERYGCYHATNEGGYISWYGFAREIFRQSGYGTEVIPVTTAEYGLSKARRPFNSRLDKSKLSENGFAPLPDWKDALRRYLATERDE